MDIWPAILLSLLSACASAGQEPSQSTGVVIIADSNEPRMFEFDDAAAKLLEASQNDPANTEKRRRLSAHYESTAYPAVSRFFASTEAYARTGRTIQFSPAEAFQARMPPSNLSRELAEVRSGQSTRTDCTLP